jgi:imidazole glycerol-phosphate synthase subunit HisH
MTPGPTPAARAGRAGWPGGDRRPTIAVVDYGMGNRRSVEKALERVGARAVVSRSHAELRAADGLLLPGVGAFPAAMGVIRELGLDALLCERAAAGTPLFGSCMGMQLLFERSEEHGGAEGLGLLRGEVRTLLAAGVRAAGGRSPAPGDLRAADLRSSADPLLAHRLAGLHSLAPPPATGLKLPHIGWSEVRWRRRSLLNVGLPDTAFLYHVHTFVAHPADPDVVLGSAEYGESFPAVVERGNVYGAQSHPEKSSAHGLRLLGNFVGICAAAAERRLAASS